MTFVSTFSRVGYARQTDIGTKAAAIGSGGSGGGTLRYLGITNMGLDLPDPEPEVKTYNSFGAGRQHAALRQGRVELRSSINFHPVSPYVLWFPFGGTSNPTLDSGNYNHTVSLENVAEPPYFTLGVGLERASNNFLRSYVGCSVDSMTVSCNEGGALETSFDIVAKDVEDEQTSNATLFTQPALSGATTYEFYDRNTTVEVMGRNTARIKGFSMTVRNNLKLHWTFQSSGAQKIARVTKGFPAFECTMNLLPAGHLTTDAIYDLIESSTLADCSIQFRKSASDVITFDMQNCLIRRAPHSLPEDGNAIEVPVTVQPSSFQMTATTSAATDFNAQ